MYDSICITECPSPLSNHPRESTVQRLASFHDFLQELHEALDFAAALGTGLGVLDGGQHALRAAWNGHQLRVVAWDRKRPGEWGGTPARLKQLCFIYIYIYTYVCVCVMNFIYMLFIYIYIQLYTYVVTICLYECLFSNLCDMNHFRIQTHPHIL